MPSLLKSTYTMNKHNQRTSAILSRPYLFRVLAIALFLAGIHPIASAQGQVQFANLGDYRLENEQVIKDCRLGYRTFGQLNANRSNAILFPTWYGGTNESLLSYIGPDQMLDSTRYFIIIVDAFGNGISSSPSNSREQPGKLFPEFSIQDMVDAPAHVGDLNTRTRSPIRGHRYL